MISQENRKTTGKNVRISEQNNVNIKMEYIIIKTIWPFRSVTKLYLIRFH
jgi:hypothetical protein